MEEIESSTPPPSTPSVSGLPTPAAQDLLREIAPMLAARGIEVDLNSLASRQSRADRAGSGSGTNFVIRQGAVRDQSAAVLRDIVDALTDGDTTVANHHLDSLAAYALDQHAPSAYSCIAVALALLDDWLDSADLTIPSAGVPAPLTFYRQAITDIIALAGKGRALRSCDTLISRQGSRAVLVGSALAIVATIRELARHSRTPANTLARTMIC